MIDRCYNPNSKNFTYYGGRGITVCERWRAFENFFADMGEKPAGMTVERNEVNGNYEPENCRWATRAEQSANTRRNVRVTVNGEEMILSEACKRLGLNYKRTKARMRALGWSFERAISEPCQNGRHKAHQTEVTA